MDSGSAVIIGTTIGVVGSLGATVFAAVWQGHRDKQRHQAEEREARRARVFAYRRKWYMRFLAEARSLVELAYLEQASSGYGSYVRDVAPDVEVDFREALNHVRVYGSRAAVDLANEIAEEFKRGATAPYKIEGLTERLAQTTRADLDIDIS